jgi:uncharacterized protein YggT (Ycf19 family)
MSDGSAGVAGLKVLKALVWVVYAIATVAVIVLAFAFFLLLFDASPQAGFAEFIYTWSLKFVGPFKGMIEPTALGNGGVIAWSTLFAIAAYSVLAWIIGSILGSISARIYRKSRPAAPMQPAVAAPTAAPVAAAPAPAAAPEPAPEAPAAPPVEVEAEPDAPAADEPPA